MIFSNISLLLYFSMIYIIGLSVIYFSKSRIKNLENKIYSLLLVINFVGLILQWGCEFLSLRYNDYPFWVSDMVFRLFILYFIVWINLMLNYVLAIAFKNGERLIFINTVFTIIESFIVTFLPFELYRNEMTNTYYTYGQAINATFLISFILMNVMFWIIVIKHKNIKLKKVIPIFIFMLFGGLSAYIQQTVPSLVIIAVSESFICFLMYHTIENPDIKMIEQLNVLRNEAERANRAKSDFLSSMSHEIRTPLNAIVGLSEDIITYKSKLPKQVKEDSEDIIDASNTLLEIVGNILDISKIESNKLDIVESEYNFVKEINTLAKINKTRIGNKPIELKLDLACDIPYELIGDKVHVKEIVNNLLSNAIKYTEKGKVDLRVKCINSKGRCNLIISVEDTGIGIKKEAIGRLFDKFDRLDVEKTTTIEGTGLGLAITKKLVNMMGGTINVSSVYGKGSIFVVSLVQKISKMEKPTETKKKKKTSKKIDYKSKTVLVVDDNILNIKVANRALSELGIKIDESTSGKDCIEKIKKGKKYDIILLDIMMPEMNGEETLEKLKDIKGFDIPVIALTADALEGSKEKYIEKGFDSYIAKPFTRDQIKEVLDEYLA